MKKNQLIILALVCVTALFGCKKNEEGDKHEAKNDIVAVWRLLATESFNNVESLEALFPATLTLLDIKKDGTLTNIPLVEDGNSKASKWLVKDSTLTLFNANDMTLKVYGWTVKDNILTLSTKADKEGLHTTLRYMKYTGSVVAEHDNKVVGKWMVQYTDFYPLTGKEAERKDMSMLRQSYQFDSDGKYAGSPEDNKRDSIKGTWQTEAGILTITDLKGSYGTLYKFDGDDLLMTASVYNQKKVFIGTNVVTLRPFVSGQDDKPLTPVEKITGDWVMKYIQAFQGGFPMGDQEVPEVLYAYSFTKDGKLVMSNVADETEKYTGSWVATDTQITISLDGYGPNKVSYTVTANTLTLIGEAEDGTYVVHNVYERVIKPEQSNYSLRSLIFR